MRNGVAVKGNIIPLGLLALRVFGAVERGPESLPNILRANGVDPVMRGWPIRRMFERGRTPYSRVITRPLEFWKRQPDPLRQMMDALEVVETTPGDLSVWIGGKCHTYRVKPGETREQVKLGIIAKVFGR